MKKLNERGIINQAIDHYGGQQQSDMMIEEMSELTKALMKYRRFGCGDDLLENVIEEIEDVQIMLDQMKLIYGSSKTVRQTKLARLAIRMGMTEDEMTEQEDEA